MGFMNRIQPLVAAVCDRRDDAERLGAHRDAATGQPGSYSQSIV